MKSTSGPSFKLGEGVVKVTLDDFKNMGKRIPTDKIPEINQLWSLLGNTHLEIAVANDEKLIEQMKVILSKINELTICEFDASRFMWKLEYGTRPLEQCFPEEWDNDEKTRHLIYKHHSIINRGKWSALHAAQKAFKKFPSLHDFDKSVLWENLGPISEPRLWHKSELFLSFNPKTNKYVIDLNRLTGSRPSFYHLWEMILKAICDVNCEPVPENSVGFHINWVK